MVVLIPVPVVVLCTEAPPLTEAWPKLTETETEPPKPGVTHALAETPVVETEADASAPIPTLPVAESVTGPSLTV
jgi:hypothetical protein